MKTEQFDVDDFMYVCRIGDLGDVQVLKSFVHQKDSQGNTGLHYASANGHIEVTKYLLSLYPAAVRKVDGSVDEKCAVFKFVNAINDTGNSALHWASFNGHREIVKLLLENGADPEIKNLNGRSASTLAEQQGHHECVNSILAVMKEREDDDDDEQDKVEAEGNETKKKELDSTMTEAAVFNDTPREE